jgi:probable HAF family extracellular repeat protein
MPAYHIQPIGLLSGGTYSIANDINNLGEVTGIADIAINEHRKRQSAVLYRPWDGLQQITAATPAPEYEVSSGHGINDLTQVVGLMTGSFWGPFLWTPGQGMTQLQAPEISFAKAINNNGMIAGTEDRGLMLGLAATWEGPSHQYRVVDDTPASEGSNAHDVNDQGSIVGFQQLGGQYKPFIVNPGAPLQTIGNSNGLANAISNNGHVVGSVGGRGFLWTAAAGFTLLDTLGGKSSAAYGVNNAGAVVGNIYYSSGQSQPFLYEAGVMTNLNNLLQSGSQWQLQDAVAINERGQIAGNGLYGSARMGYILSPLIREVILPEIIDVITHIIRHRREPLWPFGWPFPQPGPVPWKDVIPEGNDPMILACITSLLSGLSDEGLRKRLSELMEPLLKKELSRLQKGK